MADYKLSELNSIDTIRSDDLLHVRVKKRPEMLGDEDRRMTYQDFLASFKLERFVQIAGSTMTGDLGIVKLLYGGKAVFDPTDSSEITMGDVLKTFKINANGLKLTIADASRSATVYHTLNKPSPNELGMRTNEENDARYARLAITNTFQAKQSVVANGEQLTLKTPAGASEAYSAIVGRNANNDKTWAVGNLTQGSLDVHLENSRGSRITLGAIVSVNKALAITGQVQPSDFSNLDARYFTQTAANQRFAQLTGDNTFSGVNTFNQTLSILANSSALRLKNTVADAALYIKAEANNGSGKWYVGNGDSTPSVLIHNYVYGSSLRLDNGYVEINKQLKITGQVQPSDWTNIDSRYVLVGTYANLAKKNEANYFTLQQNIQSDGEALRIYSKVQNNAAYIVGKNTDNTNKWYIGCGTNGSGIATFHNYLTGARIDLSDEVLLSKSLQITGQVKPSNWTNLDARYFTQSAANKRFMLAGSTGTGSEVGDSDGIAWNAKTGLYNVTGFNGGSKLLVFQMYQGASSTPSAQLKFNYRNGGFWYRSSRDGFGFEEDWSKVYTEAQKPTPSELGAYTKAETDQKIAQAVSDSTDLNKIYPVGIVTWFNSNVNPNTALPGLTWTYLNNGVGRTIRIAAANGSDVAKTGGSDSVTLSVGNLPSHTHSFSATTSSFDYGTKNTNTTGAHTHSVSGSTSSAGHHNHAISWIGQNSTHYSGGGGGRIGTGPGYTDEGGDHTHSVSGTAGSAGNHAHSVGIGAHSHTVSGNTGGTGSGSAFSVTNKFYKLMAWVRTA